MVGEGIHMRIAVCDDDRLLLSRVSEEVRRILTEEKVESILDIFLSSLQFQEAFEKEPYDIVLLDIVMPNMDGFQLAEAIQRRWPAVSIIFLSQQKDLVYQSFGYKPFWFICKDEAEQWLPEVMMKCIGEYRKRNAYIDIGEDTPMPVKKDDLLYVECRGHKLYIHMTDDVIQRYGSLTSLEQGLGDFGFFRIHKSFVVNMDKVLYIEKDTVKLENGESVAMSKYKKGILKEKLLKGGK